MLQLGLPLFAYHALLASIAFQTRHLRYLASALQERTLQQVRVHCSHASRAHLELFLFRVQHSARHALRASFASRGAAVQLAQALALLAAIPLPVQVHQEVACLALRESTASRDAHPPAAAETVLLGVFRPSALVLLPVAARALPGDTAWRAVPVSTDQECVQLAHILYRVLFPQRRACLVLWADTVSQIHHQ